MKALVSAFGCCLLGSALTLQAGDPNTFYGKFDVGGVIQQDVKLRNPEFPGAKLTFDPGFRFDVAGGYNFSEWLAGELETGFIYSPFDKLKVDTGLARGEADLDLFLYQVPFLANLVYTVPLQSRLKPYVGGGAGGLLSVVDGEHLEDSEDDFTFAYQGMAGIAYALSDRADIGLTYKFLGSLEHDWGGIKTKETYSHSILAVFTFKF